MSRTPGTSQSRSSMPQQRAAGQIHLTEDLADYMREYAREKPEVVALWCFGIGFILGWKLKPW